MLTKFLMKKQAILKTLHYADIFDYPLRFEEIEKYLVERSSIGDLEEALTQMGADVKQISADGGYYCLLGREEIVELRKKRQVWSQPKLKKAERIASVLKFIPWIKLIGVTGALAMENSDEDDDIDLMIITSSKRLWLTRGLVVTFLRSTGQYRRANKIKDKICPNLMISEDTLEFHDRDLFTAHEIVQMKPIYDRENIYQKFLQANEWFKDFLPNAYRHPEPMAKDLSRLPAGEAGMRGHLKQVERFFAPLRMTFSKPFSLLEALAYKLQLKYMKKKKTSETTTPSIIRFHPQDLRQKVLDEYQRRVYDLPK